MGDPGMLAACRKLAHCIPLGLTAPRQGCQAISRGLSPPVADDTPGREQQRAAPRNGCQILPEAELATCWSITASLRSLRDQNQIAWDFPGVIASLSPRLMAATPRRGHTTLNPAGVQL